jgi:uncharacterized protein YjbI with pentapeptide repeats
MKFAGLLSRGYKSIATSIRSNLKPILIITATLVGLIAVIVISNIRHRLGYDWHEGTGFEGKTLWDWLDLLFIPVVLALGVYFFNRSERRNELEIAARARETDREIAVDRQRETMLQAYLDKMAKLLLENSLLDTKDTEHSAVRDVAGVQTITTLRILDVDRKNIVFQFLRDSGLADFVLIGASLNFADLSTTDMSKINLNNAFLMGADLSHSRLTEINLNKAMMSQADLSASIMFDAFLSGTHLDNANLRRTILYGANLTNALLVATDLEEASLKNAVLDNALIEHCNLKGAKVTEEQLEKARSLEGTIMPDGTVHE